MDVVREAAMSDVDEVVLVEEAWNSIIVAVGPNVSQSTGTSVAQLLALAKQVINKVPNTDRKLKIFSRIRHLDFVIKFVVALNTVCK